MTRKILSITGTRSDYGLMTPVFRAIARDPDLKLGLIVTGMHLLPEFSSSLATIRSDQHATLHYASMLLGEDSAKAMAQALGLAVFSFSAILDSERPDVLLLQGDRGEMLAGAIAGAHMNIPIIHMSGGDYSGSIDDSIRNSISKFAHFHLTTCAQSTQRLVKAGEPLRRIVEVGEPGLDLIRDMEFLPKDILARELGLDPLQPIIVAAQHSVTTEAAAAPAQLVETLEALCAVGIQTVFTYPNSDAGGREMARVLESYRDRSWLRIVANLGSQKFLSLLRVASVMVGNSSSGILEAPSFKLPVVNIGTRQHGRVRAANVIDVDYNRRQISAAVRRALTDPVFRRAVDSCVNPYGDGDAAPRTVAVLKQLRIVPSLLTKWIESDEDFLGGTADAV